MTQLDERPEPFDAGATDPEADAHALEVIGMVRKTVYDKRRDANAVVRRLKETLEELRGSVAEGLPAVGDLQDVIATSADLIEEATAIVYSGKFVFSPPGIAMTVPR